MSSTLLTSLLVVSEKAANVARVFRRSEHLFKLLVEEKKGSEQNPRFVNDYKTLADVLIQEMVRHDVGGQFPEIAPYIKGEESNVFTNSLGAKVTVKIASSQALTAAMLMDVLEGDSEAAELLAAEVHRAVELDSIDMGATELPPDTLMPIKEFGIWIDPIDSTAEFISGEEPSDEDVQMNGLNCVTVLIGVFDRMTGLPVMGVVNQPFHEQSNSLWKGQCQWGICYKDVRIHSVPSSLLGPGKVIALSASESPALKQRLQASGYHVVEVAGAGYKLLCVVLGQVAAYVLSKPTTFRWDTCAPHAILRALGGDIVKYKEAIERPQQILDEGVVSYDETSQDNCNSQGIIAFSHPSVATGLINLLSHH